MAMLSEPKRRQKLSTDPRNKAWINDGYKVGEQLMKKMGWQNGKGLGKNEDGDTNCVPTSVKNNTLGLGCSQRHDDDWITHQDDFNDLLSSLNQNHQVHDETTEPRHKPQNLREKSKKAKKRMHYDKFTKGKDLSAASTDQLNCIMGVRMATNGDLADNAQLTDDYDEDASEVRAGFGFASTNQHQAVTYTSHETSSGVQTFASSYSIEEYFAEKLRSRHHKNTSKMEALSNQNANNDTTVQDSHQTKRTKSKKKKSKSRNLPEEHINSPNSSIFCESADIGNQSTRNCETSKSGCESTEENVVIKLKKKRKKSREVVENGGSDTKSKKSKAV